VKKSFAGAAVDSHTPSIVAAIWSAYGSACPCEEFRDDRTVPLAGGS